MKIISVLLKPWTRFWVSPSKCYCLLVRTHCFHPWSSNLTTTHQMVCKRSINLMLNTSERLVHCPNLHHWYCSPLVSKKTKLIRSKSFPNIVFPNRKYLVARYSKMKNPKLTLKCISKIGSSLKNQGRNELSGKNKSSICSELRAC